MQESLESEQTAHRSLSTNGFPTKDPLSVVSIVGKTPLNRHRRSGQFALSIVERSINFDSTDCQTIALSLQARHSTTIHREMIHLSLDRLFQSAVILTCWYSPFPVHRWKIRISPEAEARDTLANPLCEAFELEKQKKKKKSTVGDDTRRNGEETSVRTLVPKGRSENTHL